MQGDCFHGVQLRTEDRERTSGLLRSDPALSKFEYYVGRPERGWVGVYPRLIVRGPKAARSLSKLLHTHSFAFRTFGDDALLYEYYRNGERHDQFCSSPEAVRQLTDMDAELAEIVEQWEQGGLSAVEYRERVDAYLQTYDAKVAEVRSRVQAAIRGRGPEQAVEAACEIVYETFRGKKADRMIVESLEGRFVQPAERRRAVEHFDARLRDGPAGGNAATFQALLQGPGGVEEVSRLLRSKDLGGLEILDRLAARLGISGIQTSYQSIENQDAGWIKVTPEEE